ncbi:unannotated protein [freshwater metagenome]|uniref:Unannotated protein n=1 Tax=freshwater metagenome TaxID=449393 RepID=A0A6J6CL83_9ZZZZ
MRPIFMPMVFTAMAPISLSWGTSVGMAAARTGVPSAMKMPAANEAAIAQEIVMSSALTMNAIAIVVQRAPN